MISFHIYPYFSSLIFLQKEEEGYYVKFDTLSDVITKAYASVAQLVEQWTENPCVAGSIPA